MIIYRYIHAHFAIMSYSTSCVIVYYYVLFDVMDLMCNMMFDVIKSLALPMNTS